MGSSTAPRISNLLPKCKFKQLKQIHAQITTTSLYQNIQILSKFLRRSTEFGNMEYPSLVFSQLGPHANAEIMLWNAMIRGFAFNGSFEKCITLYDEMLLRGLKPHNFTYPYVITSCSEMGWFRKGKQLHCRIVKTGFYSNWSVANALFIMCIKKLDSCNPDSVNKVNLNEAHNIFEDMYIKPIESWNRLITGYVSICDVESARRLFDDMPERDVVSWNSMITGYVKVGKVNHARDLFEQMPEKDVVSWTLMIGLYAYAGDIVTARRFFEQIPCRNVVSWNSMILSYNNLGQFGEALDLYVQMQRENVVPDEYTFVSVLFACSKLGALEFGKSIHFTIKDWSQMGVVLGTALIDMYAKCGDIGRAFTLFIKIGMKDEFCWNVMIRSLAIHGRTENAIKMYSFMQKVGLKPNDFTFTGVLFACSHGGLVEEGRRIFYSMKKEFGVNPKLEHYGCIIDLLSRNGQLEEALEVVKKMPYEPDIAIIGALLVGCRVRSNLKLAGEVMDMATKLQANEPGVHVMLSNMYASVGQWTEAQIVREKLEDDKITKVAGCSSVYHVASGCSEPQV